MLEVTAVTAFTREAQGALRDPSAFQWTAIPLLAVAAWVYDMGGDRGRQLRVLGILVAVDVVLGVGFGLAGWL